MRLIRIRHSIHFVFRDATRGDLPRERTIAPGLVDLDRLRALVKRASYVNGREQTLRATLGPVIAARRRGAVRP